MDKSLVFLTHGAYARLQHKIFWHSKVYQRYILLAYLLWRWSVTLVNRCLEEWWRRRRPQHYKTYMTQISLHVVLQIHLPHIPQSDFYSGDFRVIHSGGMEHQRRVAVVLDKWTAKAVDKVIYEGDRLMLVKLRGKPADVVILQIYMPTSEAEKRN